MMKTTLILIAAMLSATPALANDPAAAIRLSDLDLSQPGDVRVLDARVASAKEAVCGSYANRRPDEVARIDACRAEVDRQLEPSLAAMRGGQRVAAR